MQERKSDVHRNHVLPRGHLLPIRNGREAVIRVLRGHVWITQEGDPRDRELGPGDWFRLDRDGLAIVQAYQRSAFTLTPPRHDARGTAFERFCRGLLAPVQRRLFPAN